MTSPFSYLKRKATIILVVFLSIFVGIFSGAICALFGRILIFVNAVRTAHPFYFIPFLCLAGLCIVLAYIYWGGDSKEGMSLIFEVEYGEKPTIPVRMIPFAMTSTWISNLFGASVGREGVAVQIGATIGFRIGKLFRNYKISRLLLIAGIAGGFGGLFRTPVAAVFFALEVLIAGRLTYEALIPSIIAAFTAAFVSGKLGISAEKIILAEGITFTAANIFRIVIASILFGFAGQAFALLNEKLHKFFPKLMPNPKVRIVITGSIISIITLLLYKGRYSGLSLGITHAVFSGGTVYAWDWILKLLLTVVCLSAGFQGGELTPLFCIGSSFGFIISGILGLPAEFCAALGYASVFGSATNTFLAPVAIACEIFGFQYMPYFFIACAIAYAYNGNRTIYPKQKLSFMQFPHSDNK